MKVAETYIIMCIESKETLNNYVCRVEELYKIMWVQSRGTYIIICVQSKVEEPYIIMCMQSKVEEPHIIMYVQNGGTIHNFVCAEWRNPT